MISTLTTYTCQCCPFPPTHHILRCILGYISDDTTAPVRLHLQAHRSSEGQRTGRICSRQLPTSNKEKKQLSTYILGTYLPTYLCEPILGTGQFSRYILLHEAYMRVEWYVHAGTGRFCMLVHAIYPITINRGASPKPVSKQVGPTDEEKKVGTPKIPNFF